MPVVPLCTYIIQSKLGICDLVHVLLTLYALYLKLEHKVSEVSDLTKN